MLLPPNSPRALLIGAGSEVLEQFKDSFEYLGVEWDLCETSEDLWSRLQEQVFSLALLYGDTLSPGPIEVCRLLRERNPLIHICIVFSRDDAAERALAFELGMDHCIRLPIERLELRARLNAMLRRYELTSSTPDVSEEVLLDELKVDIAKKEASMSGCPLALTPSEYRLLEVLAQNAGRTLTLSTLAYSLWGFDSDVYEGNVKYHVSRIRKKLERDPLSPRYIKTVRGVGYRLAEPSEL